MAITDVKRLFVDTNILVYATDLNSPFHVAADSLLKQILAAGVELFITPQILREFMVATLRGFKDPNQAPYEDIVKNAEQLRTACHVLPEDTRTAAELAILVRQFHVYGKQVHDANLVAAMRVHGINDLVTHNTGDFSRFSNLIIVHPLLASS